MGSVTAARVAAPTLLDVTPRSDTRERQAASGALRTAYLGAPGSRCRGLEHKPRSSIGPGLSRLLSVS